DLQTDESARRRHQAERDDEHELPSAAVAPAPEEHATDGSCDEPHGERGEGGERADQRILRGEEDLPEHQGGRRAVQREVVPLECGPDRARRDDAPKHRGSSSFEFSFTASSFRRPLRSRPPAESRPSPRPSSKGRFRQGLLGTALQGLLGKALFHGLLGEAYSFRARWTVRTAGVFSSAPARWRRSQPPKCRARTKCVCCRVGSQTVVPSSTQLIPSADSWTFAISSSSPSAADSTRTKKMASLAQPASNGWVSYGPATCTFRSTTDVENWRIDCLTRSSRRRNRGTSTPGGSCPPRRRRSG